MIDLSHVLKEAGGPGQRGEAFDRYVSHMTAWHAASTNRSGVFEQRETVTLAEAGKSSAKASLALTGRGLWLIGHDFNNATGGTGSAPSVTASKAFESREEAIRHVAEHASRWFASEITTVNSCVSDSTRREAEKMVEILKDVIDPPAQQLALF